MYTINIVGGLGNQMFQYAFARAKALKYKTSFKLDPVFMYQEIKRKNFTFRNYGLNSFKIVQNYTLASRLAKFLPNLIYILCKLKNRLRKILHLKYYSGPSIGYDEKADKLNDGYYFDGYWQSEMYFKDFSDVIKKDFKLVNELSERSQLIKHNIVSNNSVGVHVRRGDYVKLKLSEYSNVEYYNRAIEYLRLKVDNPSFFIFSDDIDFCKRKFGGASDISFIDGSDDSVAEDLYLMSLCKHNIIANSSFSWWAAWLNENENKIVVAPLQWDKNNKSDAIVLNSWVRL